MPGRTAARPHRHRATQLTARPPEVLLAKFREYLAPGPPWLVSVHMPNGPRIRTAGT